MNIISSVLKSVFGIIVKIVVVCIKIFRCFFKKPFSDKLVIRYKCYKANKYNNNTNDFDRTDFSISHEPYSMDHTVWTILYHTVWLVDHSVWLVLLATKASKDFRSFLYGNNVSLKSF